MYQLPLTDSLIVDNFAGGGGASCGIEQALGRPVNIAINHDREAIGMHMANHPLTEHHCEDVWEVKPRIVTRGRRVAAAWFSPDCKHFSKAKGGKPVEKNIRGLAWVVVRWAATVKPERIFLENVEEFVTWGPLVKGPDGLMYPDPNKKGQTFRAFVTALERLGYVVEWRELRACDYGAPTIRKRLFLIARCDGQPIVWPEKTHGPGLMPYRTAAECIDWSIPCPSIFERARPLADNTMARIAKGIKRYVIDNPRPFIVKVNHKYEWFRGQSIEEPLDTITSKNPYALVAPMIVGAGGPARAGEPKEVDKPMGTVMVRNHSQLVSAFMVKHFGGVVGVPADVPLPTITGRGTQTQIVTSHIMKMRGTNIGHGMDEPLHTVTSSGCHHAEVRAFLIKYFGTDQDPRLDEPMCTLTTKDRVGIVTIAGEDWAIVDIGMRMLTPRELYRAQGFPDDYIIDRTGDGLPLTRTAQVRMCGNSVSPPMAKAIVQANMHGSDVFAPVPAEIVAHVAPKTLIQRRKA